MVKLEISLKRVQSFIFDVPRLKAMLGANALIGQVMRHELPELLDGQGKVLHWPPDIQHANPSDPLDGATHPADRDEPATLYKKGILARDGGHFIAVFEQREEAEKFLRLAEEKLAERLPGVLYDAAIEPLPLSEEGKHKNAKAREIVPREIQILDLPVFQVCQETGREPASEEFEEDDGAKRWRAESVGHRLDFGYQFRKGNTKDIIGLMRSALYPEGWSDPDDLAQLAAGGYVALIHADGNGIGKRYNEWKDQAKTEVPIAKEAHGEAFFHGMRVAVRRAVVDALGQTFTPPAKKRPRPYEVLMLGGDDLLLICRADQALKLAIHYAAELKKYPLADGKALDMAIGIAIAQKTYPLHRLHELAESLASSAKRLYRSLEDKASVIDWQVVTQSWFVGVAEARRQSDLIQYTVNGETETLLLTGRPYRVLGEEGLEGLRQASEALDADGEARSPLRSVRAACERGRLAGKLAFAGLAKPLQAKLGWSPEKNPALWKPIGGDDRRVYLTRALDIIGIREIARLGRKKND